MNPLSTIVRSITSIFGAKQQTKQIEVQAAAQMYIAGEMTEQEYLRYLADQEAGLTGMASQVYGTRNETDYLPMIAVVGLFVVLALLIFKKN